MENPASGVYGYSQMKPGWKELTEKIRAQVSLKQSDEFIGEAVQSWHAEEKDIALLETEKEELTAVLSKGDLSNEDLMSLGQRIGIVVEHLDTKTNRWIELAELA